MAKKTQRSINSTLTMLHMLCHTIKIDDVVLCNDGKGDYYIGRVVSDYNYNPHLKLQHSRSVEWGTKKLYKRQLGSLLLKSMQIPGMVRALKKYDDELSAFLNYSNIRINDEISDESNDWYGFKFEKYLEQFLVENWHLTEFSQDYEIYKDDEQTGQQFQTDTGAIDLLAVKKDLSGYLVIELKKGKTGDKTLGQIQRYMGYIKSEVATESETVHGAIVALEPDLRLQRALSVTQNIDFYQYEMNFNLKKS